MNMNTLGSTNTTNTNTDPLFAHLTRDLPQHIVERRLGPGSGRMMRTYRIRHVESGAVIVMKAMVVRLEMDGAALSRRGGTAAVGGGGSLSGGGKEDGGGVSSSHGMSVGDGGNNNDGGGSREYGSMKQSHLMAQQEELFKLLSTLSPPSSPSSSSSLSSFVSPSPNTLPYHHWFVSGYSNILPSSPRASGGGIVTSATATSIAQKTTSATNLSTNSTTNNANNSSTNTPTNNTNTPNQTNTHQNTPQPQNNIHETALYLLRPHTYTTLSDRIATRPFLTTAEKTFLSFQILRAVRDLHARHICHGHLTAENVGITSWNWVLLMDISTSGQGGCCFAKRPVAIPDDDPSDWIYYFQERDRWDTEYTNDVPLEDVKSLSQRGSAGEKRCYLAPERFYTRSGKTDAGSSKGSTSTLPPTELHPAMDVFSLGCILIELHLNGERAMDLGDLMEYRAKNGDLSKHSSLQQKLNKIDSAAMRAACRHMLSLDPKKRLSAGEYLERLTFMDNEMGVDADMSGGVQEEKRVGGMHLKKDTDANVTKNTSGNQSNNMGNDGGGNDGTSSSPSPSIPPIPPCYESVLFPLLSRVRTEVMSPDARIAMAAANYGRVLRATVGIEDLDGEAYFRRIVGPTMFDLEQARVTDGVGNGSKVDGEDGNAAVPHDPSNDNDDDGNEKKTKSNRFACNPFQIWKVSGGGADDDADGSQCEDHLLAETEELLRQIDLGSLFALYMDPSEDNQKDKDNGNNNHNNNNQNATHDHHHPYHFSPTAFHETNKPPTPSAAALVIFTQFILSTIRHTQRPSSKLVSLQLLLHLSKFSTDEVRLQRIVPTTVSLLQDADASVRGMAVKVLSCVLSLVKNFPPSDAQVFPQYVLKRVSVLLSDSALSVRVAFAECIAVLAETALRFLNACHAIRLYESVDGESGGGAGAGVNVSGGDLEGSNCEKGSIFDDDVANLLGGATETADNAGDNDGGQSQGSQKEKGKVDAKHTALDKNKKKKKQKEEFSVISSDLLTKSSSSSVLITNTYDKELLALHETVAKWVVFITTNSSEDSSPLKQALLHDLARLCNFFGHEGVMACVLPQVLAFLNDRKDWQLRASLCQQLPAICTIVGRAATEQFVVPCVETALVDEEDLVICSAVLCLSSLVEMGLLTRAVLLGTRTRPRNAPSSSMPSKLDVKSTVPPRGEGTFSNSNPGIIEKYSSLLVYPSGDVRKAASNLFATCCRAVGFPDDEVFVIPLLEPFFRYDVPRNRLKTSEEILSCLMPPLTRKELDHELDRLQWTSVGVEHNSRQNTNHQSSNAIEGGAETKSALSDLLVQYQSDERRRSAYLESLNGYLKMLRKNAKKQSRNDGKYRQRIRVIDDRIEGLEKAAFSFYIPNQKYAEMLTTPLPAWYDQLRQVSSSDPLLNSETSCLRSMNSLSKVYGITMVQGSNSGQPQRRKKRSDFMYDPLFDSTLSLEKDEPITQEKARMYLSEPTSNVFSSAMNGQWGAVSLIDPALAETNLHVSKITSLGIPSVPPRLGVLRDEEGKQYSFHGSPGPSNDTDADTARRHEWKPKADILVASTSPTSEHTAPVTRLAVSQDQAFFVSASHDGSSKVWEMRQVEDSIGDLRSCLTYTGHNSSSLQASSVRINDLTIIENSHSVATAGSDGAVHAWRVDMVSTKQSLSSATGGTTSSNQSYEKSRVSGYSMLRNVNPEEGEVLALSHFNTPSASIIAFATQRGIIHSWDLRCAKEPFSLSMQPELGHLTSMAVGSDRNWMVAGTNRGFLGLWDIRFQKLVKLWQHGSGSPIARLGTSFATLPQDNESKPYVVLGCGLNETSIFDVAEGTCRQCFRVLDPALSYVDQSALPSPCITTPKLYEVPIPTEAQRRISGMHGAVNRILYGRFPTLEPNIGSFVGRVGTAGQNYLVTGGSDGFIRYWDFSSPSKCFTVSGLLNTQPRPAYESVSFNSLDGKGSCNLILCRQMPVPTIDEMESSKIPKKLERGPVRPEHHHRDAILDMKKIEYPMKGLLSCSRDGHIKLWR